jgi:hypothetical protein
MLTRRREHMERIELLWRLVEREPLVRWSAVATLVLVWLTVAWLSPLPLLVAALLVATVYSVRRKRGIHLAPRADDELDLL